MTHMLGHNLKKSCYPMKFTFYALIIYSIQNDVFILPLKSADQHFLTSAKLCKSSPRSGKLLILRMLPVWLGALWRQGYQVNTVNLAHISSTLSTYTHWFLSFFSKSFCWATIEPEQVTPAWRRVVDTDLGIFNVVHWFVNANNFLILP